MPGGVGLFWVGWGKGQGGIEVWHVSKKIIPERLLQTCAHIIYVCTYGTVIDYTYIYTYIIMYIMHIMHTKNMMYSTLVLILE